MPVNGQVDTSRTHHGRVRRQCARPLGIQAGEAFARGAPGRADDRDVRVPERAEPHDGGAGHPELRAAPRPWRTSTRSSASASSEYTLKPGESKQWPVVFVIDPKLSKDVKTITLSYTFFEVGGSVRRPPGMAPRHRQPSRRVDDRREASGRAGTCSFLLGRGGGGVVVLRRSQVERYEQDVEGLNPVHLVIAGVVGGGAVHRRAAGARQLGVGERRREVESNRPQARIEEISRRQHVGSDTPRHTPYYFVPAPSRYPVMASFGLFW